jgi:hypothetical protein
MTYIAPYHRNFVFTYVRGIGACGYENGFYGQIPDELWNKIEKLQALPAYDDRALDLFPDIGFLVVAVGGNRKHLHFTFAGEHYWEKVGLFARCRIILMTKVVGLINRFFYWRDSKEGRQLRDKALREPICGQMIEESPEEIEVFKKEMKVRAEKLAKQLGKPEDKAPSNVRELRPDNKYTH